MMKSSTPATPVARILMAFAGLYVIWGTTYLAIALSIQSLPPFTSGALRFFTAALLMYGWLRIKSPQPLEGIDIKKAALCGVLLTGFGNGLVVWAQQGVPSGIAALIVAAIPIFVVLVECAFFAGRWPQPRAAFGMLIATIGVAVIVTHTRTLSGAAKPIYIAAILLAVLSWSFGTLIQRQAGIKPARILAFTCVQIFFGALLQLSMAILNREWQVLDVAHVSATSLLATLYLVIFGSVIALSCYSWLLTQVAAQKVATYALVNPVVALILGALILGETISATAVFAALGVLVGISLVLFPNWRWPLSKPVTKSVAANEAA
jgi:drug/metabolite transporter (DMT)-like permease